MLQTRTFHLRFEGMITKNYAYLINRPHLVRQLTIARFAKIVTRKPHKHNDSYFKYINDQAFL